MLLECNPPTPTTQKQKIWGFFVIMLSASSWITQEVALFYEQHS